MNGAVGIIAAFSKPESAGLRDVLSNYLAAAGRTVYSEADLATVDQADLAAIMVLGGDGLMMRAANSHSDVPLFGINFGKVGFLAMVEQQDWKPAVDQFLAGNYSIDNGATLQATIFRDGSVMPQGWAINDVVIRGGVRMIEIEIYIDGRYVNTYPGDGMIASTPRGSTAYCMAAGGPILTAGVQGVAIVPISAHTPIRTPFVVAESAVIELVLSTRHEAGLILDGRPTVELQEQDVVRVTKGDHEFRLVTLESMNFYDAFRTKFNYRVRPDAVPSRRAMGEGATGGTLG
jgi:NAD+ kinase